MDKLHFEELTKNLSELEHSGELTNKKIYIFGHCNATEVLIDCLLERGYKPSFILDNNVAKHGNSYKGVPIVSPTKIMEENAADCIVCIVARAYAAMVEQLKRLGYIGTIRKLVDYNSYADYSLSEDTMGRMQLRVERGRKSLELLHEKYPEYLKIMCPFAALGDIYFMMSYLPYYLEKRKAAGCVICVIGNACAKVVKLFGKYNVEVFSQKDMDELIQATLYTQDKQTFIAHQDRPYVVDLHKALYIKKIPLQQIYCCGVFGLPVNARVYEPSCFEVYSEIDKIQKGQAVILSPSAKSVTALPDSLWQQIIENYRAKGYQCFTNIAGDEKPLPGTEPISPLISEMKSVVEQAGTFIGIRSGLCDVLTTVNAKKIALYPDYNYSDTKWKAIDMYSIEGWENIEVKDGFEWKWR